MRLQNPHTHPDKFFLQKATMTKLQHSYSFEEGDDQGQNLASIQLVNMTSTQPARHIRFADDVGKHHKLKKVKRPKSPSPPRQSQSYRGYHTQNLHFGSDSEEDPLPGEPATPDVTFDTFLPQDKILTLEEAEREEAAKKAHFPESKEKAKKFAKGFKVKSKAKIDKIEDSRLVRTLTVRLTKRRPKSLGRAQTT